MFTGVYDNGYFIEKTTFGARSPSTGRTLPDRYIEGACRSAATRAHAATSVTTAATSSTRPTGEPPLADQRRDPGVRRDPAFLPRPPGAGRRPQGVARRARGEREVAAERDPVPPEHPGGDPSAAMTHDIDWGIPVPFDGWRDDPTSGSTSGSTRSSAISRRASSGPVVRATQMLGAAGGTRRRRERTQPGLLLHGQGQHHLPIARSGLPSCWPTRATGTRAARPGSSANSTCRPRSSPRILDDGGQESPPRSAWSSSSATCSAATSPTRSATSSPLPDQRTRTPTSPGRIRSPYQRRASPDGKPGRPQGDDDRRTSARSPARAS